MGENGGWSDGPAVNQLLLTGKFCGPDAAEGRIESPNEMTRRIDHAVAQD